jgi:hypothetical protein
MKCQERDTGVRSTNGRSNEKSESCPPECFLPLMRLCLWGAIALSLLRMFH